MATVLLENGSDVEPVATFNQGASHFIIDDDCYVLINKGATEKFRMSAWIFPEALEVLRRLPPLPV